MDALKSKGQMYDQIDLGKISRSGFDLSWNNKGTGKIGRIIPTRCTEVLPGDRFKGSSAAAVQFEPLAVPILANMDVRQEHFYVPNNIVWKNWDRFISGGEKLDDASVLPTISIYSVMMALLNAGVAFPDIKLHPYWTTKPASGETRGVNTCTGWLAYWRSDGGDGISQHVTKSRDQLVAFGNKYGCLDLLAPCFEVCDKVLDLFSGLATTNPDVNAYQYYDQTGNVLYGLPLATNLLNHVTIGSTTNDTDPWNWVAYSNVMAKSVIPALKAIAAADSTTYLSAPRVVYTENGYALFDLFYDFYRPFVGVGSNLDYLNYTRVSIQDVYTMLLAAYTLKKSNLDTTNFGYIYQSIGSFDEENFSKQAMSVLPLRANYLIWYNYYRDQLLEMLPSEPSVEDTVTDVELLNLVLPRQRCWAKDTFTTALANTGTGNVVVPVNNKTSSDKTGITYLTRNGIQGTDVDSAGFIDADVCRIETSNGDKIDIPTRFISGLSPESKSGKLDSSVSYFSLDMLDACRRAQKWLQKALIYGNRIQDRLFTSFGVKFLDNRLHLPEFLASSRQLVQLSVTTNPTTIVTDKSSTIAGDKSANAYAYDKGGDFNRFCEEHGFIMSYLTIMPEVTYAYGTSRHYSKLDKFDYAWPEFATIGMDAVYVKELCDSSLAFAGNSSHEVFGYQGRYYDYKAKQDEEHGELQTTQNMYTFSRQFDILDPDSKPKLNYIFVHCWPSLDMFVVDSSLVDYFRYDIHHSVAAERPLPVCGMYL